MLCATAIPCARLCSASFCTFASIDSTTLSPFFGGTCPRVESASTTSPRALTAMTCFPGTPRRYLSYSSSTPAWPTSVVGGSVFSAGSAFTSSAVIGPMWPSTCAAMSPCG